jgi:hypothetical protein
VPNLGKARVYQQSVEPSLEAIVIAQAAQLAPGRQESLLDRVLSSTRVPKNPERD